MPAALPTLAPGLATPASQWDIFCRVIDNFGDIGVCWRLAADLGSRGHQVRLWVDDDRALAWMAPSGATGVQLRNWNDLADDLEPGEVVVEAFGCDPPEPFVSRMARQHRPPVWINLEYLSAEAYVERSHRLPSPQLSGPGRGLVKWFYYPGFTPKTGGLLRQPGQVEAALRDDPAAFFADLTVAPRRGERCVSAFGYPDAHWSALAAGLADAPTLLLALPGGAANAWQDQALPATVRLQVLPWLRQTDYDRLLRACDLNLVRGEDSFVRAQWAGRPFLWHLYAQHDFAHAAKLDAFLARFLAGAAPALSASVAAWMRHWNRLAQTNPGPLPDLVAWQRHTERWRDGLLAQPDLVTQLLDFVEKTR